MKDARCLVEIVDARRIPLQGAADCILIQGQELAPRRPQVNVFLNGVNDLSLPASWSQLKVMHQPTQGAGCLLRLVAAGSDQPVYARSVQVHRDASAAMFDVLPPVQPPLRLRLFWWLLPRLLRIPGAAALLRARS